MAIKYADVKAGDTLVVVGNHTLNGRTSPFKQDEPVQVETVGEHFVDVRKKGEKETHRFAFEHGREKLEYTEETSEAIAKRAKFDAEETVGDGGE